MAKRHYDGRKAMLEKREYYADHDSRKHQEAEDGGMIREDHNAMANMPQEIIMKHYPKPIDYLPENLDDTIKGVDRLMAENDRVRDRHFKPKKT